MKLSFLIKNAAYSLFAFISNLVFAAALPPGYPPGLYDEEKVPQFTLPDPLVMLNGDKVSDVNTWKEKRRPEILKLFETNVYGRTMIGRPNDMSWKITAENRSDMNGIAITKTVTIYFTGKTDGPKMDVNIEAIRHSAVAGRRPGSSTFFREIAAVWVFWWSDPCLRSRTVSPILAVSPLRASEFGGEPRSWPKFVLFIFLLVSGRLRSLVEHSRIRMHYCPTILAISGGWVRRRRVWGRQSRRCRNPLE